MFSHSFINMRDIIIALPKSLKNRMDKSSAVLTCAKVQFITGSAVGSIDGKISFSKIDASRDKVGDRLRTARINKCIVGVIFLHRIIYLK